MTFKLILIFVLIIKFITINNDYQIHNKICNNNMSYKIVKIVKFIIIINDYYEYYIMIVIFIIIML